jgi:hypothetical protein
MQLDSLKPDVRPRRHALDWVRLVGQAILPADTLSSVSRRRLKAGGSQDWLPH